MNNEKLESESNDNHAEYSTKDMSHEEVCNWMALCNALKFINNTSQLTGKKVEEKDIDYREMLNYIHSVSGDISTCLEQAQGIPFKYSLTSRNEEALDMNDLSYEFLDK